MSNLNAFFKGNKKQKKNEFFPATASLADENGNPLLWELRAVSTKENDKLRDACTDEVQLKGKPGQYRQRVDSSLYMKKLVCASVVFPDLHDPELQNSYGVMCAEDLLCEMVDNAGEYTALTAFVQKICGFTSIMEDVEEAKN